MRNSYDDTKPTFASRANIGVEGMSNRGVASAFTLFDPMSGKLKDHSVTTILNINADTNPSWISRGIGVNGLTHRGAASAFTLLDPVSGKLKDHSVTTILNINADTNPSWISRGIGVDGMTTRGAASAFITMLDPASGKLETNYCITSPNLNVATTPDWISSGINWISEGIKGEGMINTGAASGFITTLDPASGKLEADYCITSPNLNVETTPDWISRGIGGGGIVNTRDTSSAFITTLDPVSGTLEANCGITIRNLNPDPNPHWADKGMSARISDRFQGIEPWVVSHHHSILLQNIRIRFEVKLPLQFNDGRAVPAEMLEEAKQELLELFGGVSWDIQPRGGLWKDGTAEYRDTHVSLIVDAPDRDDSRRSMKKFKERWRQRLGQVELYMTTSVVEIM